MDTIAKRQRRVKRQRTQDAPTLVCQREARSLPGQLKFAFTDKPEQRQASDAELVLRCVRTITQEGERSRTVRYLLTYTKT